MSGDNGGWHPVRGAFYPLSDLSAQAVFLSSGSFLFLAGISVPLGERLSVRKHQGLKVMTTPANNLPEFARKRTFLR